MSVDTGRPAPVDPASRPGRLPRVPQALVAGLVLAALAAFALWATRDLPQGTLRAMGPAMLPRWLAVGVGLCGVALVAATVLKAAGDEVLRRSDYAAVLAIAVVVTIAAGFAAALGVPFVAVGLVLFYGVLAALFVAAVRGNSWLDASGLRGPFFVIAGILTFAITIRPFTMGGFTTPGLGLVVAGPLTILIGGFATPEVRLRDLLILALALTPFCMLLFGDMLNLPIPLFPQALADTLFAGWSQKQVLRATAAILVAAAFLVFLLTRGGGQDGPIDVVDHAGELRDADNLSSADHLGSPDRDPRPAQALGHPARS